MTLQKLTLFCVFCVMQCVYAARGSNLFKNTHTHLTLYQLHIYSLTASFSCKTNVSGYVCNHGSPSGERDTASPRGHYGERLQRDSCLKKHMKKHHTLAGDSP